MNWPHLQRSKLGGIARTSGVLLLALALVALIAIGGLRADLRLHTYAAQNQGDQDAPRDAVRELSSADNSKSSASSDARYARLAERAAREGSVRVIVGLEIEAQPEASLSVAGVSSQRLRIAQGQAALLSRISSQSLRGVKLYSFIPYLALEVDATALEQLRNAPEQKSIEEDGMRFTSLAESVPLIGAPSAWANGFSGSGQAVAILDTGVSKTHSFLSGKVVSEACYSTNSAQTSSVCPGGATQSTASGSGVNCSLGGCDHGTHVAGIAAGTSVAFSGVARDANIVAIQVFSGVNGCSGSNCVTAFDSDIILGLQRVQQLSGSFNIAAVNLSLGGSGSGRTCDATATAFKAAVDSLRALGIATVVASGNNASNGGMSFPACISTTVSVGSTGDGSNGSITDLVSSYSNSVSFLNLLAPGEMINSSVPGNGFAIFRGTSMATPHVTGAWAVLKSKTPGATVPQVLLALTNTGIPVIDPRNGVSKPRIQVDAAATALQSNVCNYSITPGSQSVGQLGGPGSVSVTSDAGCSWTAISNVPWITIPNGASGIGNGNVSLQIGANFGVEREGTVLIAGQKYIVSQAGITTFLVDDGSFENASGLQLGGTSYRVNRLTPSSYPATINAVAIYFPGYTGVRIGDSFNVIYGSNPGGGSNIDGVAFSFASASVQTLDQFNVYVIPQQTINSGDFVVGMQYNNAVNVLPFAIDTTAPSQGRSYRSTNGSTFTLIDNIGTPGNYGIRAIPVQSISCPSVVDINPTLGSVGSSVAINGSHFTGVTSVRFSNSVAAPFSVSSDGLINATVPPGSVSGPISLSKAGCSDVQTSSFSILACPTISGLSSSSGTIGSSLTISGTNLTGVTAVTFSNGVAASFTVNSATQITTNVPVGAVTGAISFSKSGCSDVQSAVFTVIPCPTVSGISPVSGLIGSSVIISGSSFTGVTAVKFSNNVSATFSVDSNNQITATVPVGAVSGPITLTRPGCGDVQTASFTVIPCPSVSGINPATGLIGSTVIISGSSFTGVTVVKFSNNVSALFSVDSNSQITTTVPVGAVSGPITLTRPGCGDVQTASFTVIPCPTVSGISPSSGLIGSSVIISGSSFTGVTAVKFSNNVSATFTIDNNNQITATVPVGAVSGPITLTRPGCGDVQTTSFTVIPCPTVSGISPSSGLTGSSLIISGSSFSGVTAVKFSNNVSATFSVDSSNQIAATVPVGAVSGPITLTRPGCGEVQTTTFTVIPCPTVSGISPGSGLIGSNVIISGSSFTGITGVKFSNNVSASFSIDNNNQITATVPVGAISGPITLVRPGCGDAQSTSFTVINCPTILFMSPDSGMVGSTVFLFGINFDGVTSVKFSNDLSASFTINSSGQITATVPVAASSGPITIGKPGCGDVQTTSFTVTPPCSYSLSSSVRNFSALAGSGSIDVTAGAACGWNVTNVPSWVHLTAGPNGAGNGTVTFNVDANPGNVRAAVMTIAGQPFTVRQGANFLDVPQNDIFYDFIGKLSAAGVTAGCDANGPLYCPGGAVTREQMAAFIIRALGNFNPPTPPSQRFIDVPPGNLFYAFVEQMAVQGITLGCSAQGPQYCPAGVVTREQMAAFIIRALGDFNPPTPSAQRFVDVSPTNPFYAFIEQMAVRGITLGCDANGPLYCPSGQVTRGQMAAFLVRAFGL